MPQDEKAREGWAKRTAVRLVDGILGATEWSAGPHPTPDQVALLREIVRRALWHMRSSGDEARDLVCVDVEDLEHPHPSGLKTQRPPTKIGIKPSGKMRAAELAARAIDGIADAGATPEERNRRRLRLTKGPLEFREDRVDQPKLKK